MTLHQYLENCRHAHVHRTLKRCGGNITHAATKLGMNRTHIYRVMKRLGLQLENYR